MGCEAPASGGGGRLADDQRRGVRVAMRRHRQVARRGPADHAAGVVEARLMTRADEAAGPPVADYPLSIRVVALRHAAQVRANAAQHEELRFYRALIRVDVN